MFGLIRPSQPRNVSSDLNTPFFSVTLPVFLIPGVEKVENSGRSP